MNATKTKSTKIATQWLVFNTHGEIVGTDPKSGAIAWMDAEHRCDLTREQMTRIGYLCVKCDISKAREE